MENGDKVKVIAAPEALKALVGKEGVLTVLDTNGVVGSAEVQIGDKTYSLEPGQIKKVN